MRLRTKGAESVRRGFAPESAFKSAKPTLSRDCIREFLCKAVRRCQELVRHPYSSLAFAPDFWLSALMLDAFTKLSLLLLTLRTQLARSNETF